MEFEKFNKIPSLTRNCTITEKIDGTNAQIYIIKESNILPEYWEDGYEEEKNFISKYSLFKNEEFLIFAGSRSRWLDTSSKGDNFGFAKWVEANAEELIKLGEGRHYGEWWGKGVQRGYDMEEKVFSLFNTNRWKDNPDLPKCCRLVPILYEGVFDTKNIESTINILSVEGSKCSPEYKNPEGIVIYHKASNRLFKKTIKNDESPKELINESNTSKKF